MDGVALPVAFVVLMVASEAGTQRSRAQAVDSSRSQPSWLPRATKSAVAIDRRVARNGIECAAAAPSCSLPVRNAAKAVDPDFAMEKGNAERITAAEWQE